MKRHGKAAWSQSPGGQTWQVLHSSTVNTHQSISEAAQFPYYPRLAGLPGSPASELILLSLFFKLQPSKNLPKKCVSMFCLKILSCLPSGLKMTFKLKARCKRLLWTLRPQLTPCPWAKLGTLKASSAFFPSFPNLRLLPSHLSGSILTASVLGNACGSDTARCARCVLLCSNLTPYSNWLFERLFPG